MRPVRRVVLLAIAMVTALIPAAPAAIAATGPAVFVNEFHYDNTSTDVGEAIEIAGPAGTDLTGWSIVLYNGANGLAYNTTALSGTLPDQQSGFGTTVVAYPTNGIQNGSPDGIALVDAANGVVQFLSYEGSFTAADGPANGLTSVDIGVTESSSTALGESLQLGGTGTVGGDFTWEAAQPNTFGAVNTSQTFGGTTTLDPLINEFVANHTGADSEAFIEVFGSPSTDYSAYTVLEIEGDSSGAGVIDAVLPVATTSTDGYWVDPEDVENGTLTIVLVEGFTGSVGQDLDTDNDGAFEVTPWTRIVDDVATTDGGSSDAVYSSTVLGPFFDGQPFGAGGASRIPNGTDTDTTSDWLRNDFDGFGFAGFAGSPAIGEAENTPGADNVAIAVLIDPLGECRDPATVISFIQGTGLVSSDLGSIREIEGVVVGDFQDDLGTDGDLDGFFVQEEDADADGDPLTSEGIFVFQGSNPTLDVAKGDVVRVRGSVDEFGGQTQLTNLASVEVCGTGSASPATVTLPIGSIDDYEALEGMAIVAGDAQDLYISEYFNFDRFGEIVLTPDRLYQPTALFEPGSADAATQADLNARSRLTLDDGRTASNPDPARHPNGLEFTLDNRFRGGDILRDVAGVMSEAFNLYRIQPTGPATYIENNPRPATPDSVGGSMTVAAFNVLNYFNTLDYPSGDPLDNACGPDQNQGCRGADDEGERIRQLDKIVSAMSVMDADVLGIIEVENTAGVEAMADIVEGLNGIAGPGTYDYIDTGTVGDDAIKVGFIYQPGSVNPVGDFAVLDDPAFVAPFGVDRNRAALAQTFVEEATGGKFTAVVNHFKSKGSPCGPGDDDPETGSCNLTRTVAAQVLADWLETDPTGSGDPDVLIVGDLNSYDKEDPIDALRAAGYVDLLGQYQGELAYSFVFDSQLGYLDYGMANESLAAQVTGTTAWHINTDEPDLLDYDTSFKRDAQDAIYAPDAYRSSDHDPVIVGLDLNASPSCDFAEPSIGSIWPPNHEMVDIEILGCTDADGDEITITIDSIFQDEPVNADDDANTAPDGDGIGTSIAQVRAERSGEGDGRVYHIAFTASDEFGNTTTGEVTVEVRLSRKTPAVDDGPIYDSTIVP